MSRGYLPPATLAARDVTRVFLTLIRALEATNEVIPHGTNETSCKVRKKPDAFSFHNRATSLHTNLQNLSTYIRRVQQLTGTTVGNRVKQKMHTELMEQVSILVDQCTALLTQLNEVSQIDEVTCMRLNKKQTQTMQHRRAVFESLEGQLNTLRRLRNMEVERQRHLSELTGTLAAGFRSVSPSSMQQVTDMPSGQREREQAQPPVDVIERITPNNTDITATELQAFEHENRLMYEHLSEQRDELHLVARTIHEIGKLNQTLSAHLSEQFETVQQIGAQFSTSTGNVRQGNELLRSALSSKASAQFWILFTMIVLTFSLHFLDWYYP